MLKDEAPAKGTSGPNSPKYFDNVKQFLKSVVGDDKAKVLPLKDLAAVGVLLSIPCFCMSVCLLVYVCICMLVWCSYSSMGPFVRWFSHTDLFQSWLFGSPVFFLLMPNPLRARLVWRKRPSTCRSSTTGWKA